MPQTAWAPVEGLVDDYDQSYLGAVRKSYPDLVVNTVESAETTDEGDPTGRVQHAFEVVVNEKKHILRFAAGVGGMRAKDMPAIVGRWVDRWKAR